MPESQYRHLTSHTENGVLVLTLTDPQIRGDEAAENLRKELLAAVAEAGAGRVVLDLSRVTYMSSVAFRPLLQLHGALKDRQGRIVLCNLAEPVREVLHLTRLISTSRSSRSPFEEQPDVAAAVASLAPQAAS
jgi:anti-anti-sigma factor